MCAYAFLYIIFVVKVLVTLVPYHVWRPYLRPMSTLDREKPKADRSQRQRRNLLQKEKDRMELQSTWFSQKVAQTLL